MELKRVVLGVDASPAAAGAARWAAEAVRDSGGEVLAVHGTGASELGRQAARGAAYGLGLEVAHHPPLDDRWTWPLRAAGVAYRTVVAEADPVDALLDIARREGADLIVIGHESGTGLLDRLMRGLSDQLVDQARRPVVVVPFQPEPT